LRLIRRKRLSVGVSANDPLLVDTDLAHALGDDDVTIEAIRLEVAGGR
jgi:hypothetical protein